MTITYQVIVISRVVKDAGCINPSHQEFAAMTTQQTDRNAPAQQSASQLRTIMRANAAFSTITGIVGLLAGGPVAEFLEVDQVWFIRLLGAGLLGFAGFTFTISRSGWSVLRTWSQIISFNDLGWVAGTILVIAMDWLSTKGAIVMGLIAIGVLDFGLLQLRARSRANAQER